MTMVGWDMLIPTMIHESTHASRRPRSRAAMQFLPLPTQVAEVRASTAPAENTSKETNDHDEPCTSLTSKYAGGVRAGCQRETSGVARAALLCCLGRLCFHSSLSTLKALLPSSIYPHRRRGCHP